MVQPGRKTCTQVCLNAQHPFTWKQTTHNLCTTHSLFLIMSQKEIFFPESKFSSRCLFKENVVWVYGWYIVKIMPIFGIPQFAQLKMTIYLIDYWVDNLTRSSKPTSQFHELKGLKAKCKIPAWGLSKPYSGHELQILKVRGSRDSSPGLRSMLLMDPAVRQFLTRRWFL